MNSYPISIYNATVKYCDRIRTNTYIRAITQKVIRIDLCKKQYIHEMKAWVGITNSLNCSKSHINYYISKNMDLSL